MDVDDGSRRQGWGYPFLGELNGPIWAGAAMSLSSTPWSATRFGYDECSFDGDGLIFCPCLADNE
jgi:hypothetical protein